jgi:hypothetical protein
LIDRERAAALEIRRYAFFQAAGFADVNDPAEAILHQVNARLVRQLADFFLQRDGLIFAHVRGSASRCAECDRGAASSPLKEKEIIRIRDTRARGA